MQQTQIDYFDGNQKLIATFLNHDNTQPRPGIIVYPAFEGRGDFALNYARNLAAQGFNVLLADMYGNAEVANTIEGCFHLIGPFLQDRSLTRRRAILAHEVLIKQKSVLSTKIGAIGFCFGGMCALELARAGISINAVISVHGVLAKSELITKPISARILALHGYCDPQVPPDQLKSFAEEMSAAKVNDWTFTYFGLAKHSFTDPHTGSFDPDREKEMGREYNAVAAARSFRYALDYFQETLLS